MGWNRGEMWGCYTGGMDTICLRAYWLGNEIGLDALAQHFGLSRRSKWEDLLHLDQDNLAGVLREPQGKGVDLVTFGCIVAWGMGHHEVVDLVAYLRKVQPRLLDPDERFQDDLLLQIGAEVLEIRDDRVALPSLDPWRTGILSTVHSKSVALERVEHEIERLLDDAEPVVQNLSRGRVSPSDRKVSSLSGQIMSFRLDTVSYIQLLDKPDATWDNPEAEDFYGRLSQLFELQERYDKIQAKSTVLMDLTGVVTNYAHHHHSARLEWMIILLIVFEILLSLYEMFVRVH